MEKSEQAARLERVDRFGHRAGSAQGDLTPAPVKLGQTRRDPLERSQVRPGDLVIALALEPKQFLGRARHDALLRQVFGSLPSETPTHCRNHSIDNRRQRGP